MGVGLGGGEQDELRHKVRALVVKFRVHSGNSDLTTAIAA